MLSLRRLVVSALVVAFLGAAPVVAIAQQHFDGKTGPGSLYVIDVPANWNGSLVLYAHGIVQADQPVALPTTQDGYGQMRDALLAAGYAVAASSFSSNGWTLADAVQRTHQLGELFVAKVGQPSEILLAGHSLGGLAIIKLAEKYPTQYSGALAMCAPLGGGVAEIGYAADARVTFDYYFPGVLPGTPFQVPPDTQFVPPGATSAGSPLFWTVYNAMAAKPGNLLQWAQAARLPFETGNMTEMFATGLYFIGFQLRYTNDFIERVNGKIPYDNSTTQYAVAPTPDPATNAYLSGLLNSGVTRFSADPAAINYYERNYDPTGQLQIPVVTLHTDRDPGVPFWHEALYAEKVAAAGSSAFLTQIPVSAWGHCAFQPGDMLNAFNTLVAQVNAAAK